MEAVGRGNEYLATDRSGVRRHSLRWASDKAWAADVRQDLGGGRSDRAAVADREGADKEQGGRDRVGGEVLQERGFGCAGGAGGLRGIGPNSYKPPTSLWLVCGNSHTCTRPRHLGHGVGWQKMSGHHGLPKVTDGPAAYSVSLDHSPQVVWPGEVPEFVCVFLASDLVGSNCLRDHPLPRLHYTAAGAVARTTASASPSHCAGRRGQHDRLRCPATPHRPSHLPCPV